MRESRHIYLGSLERHTYQGTRCSSPQTRTTSRRFRPRPMELLSRRSTDSGRASAVKDVSPTFSSATNPTRRPCYPKPTRGALSCIPEAARRRFDTGQLPDLIVRCRQDEYHVHRVIMCSHSQWFARVCPKLPLGTATSSIDLSAEDSDAVDAMFQYCYRLDYTDNFLSLSSAGYLIHSPTPHIDIYLLADRYSIPALKLLAAEKFRARAAVLSQVESNKDRFFQAVQATYASTPSIGTDTLRQVAVKLCADHSEQFILQGHKTAARIFRLMDETPAFRVDFIKELALRLD
ncbi:hypothetical protein BS50DRAFT_249250 [Corynespora cassiicola Philippines]|uniref:BTB domain-containing protein n=1 Tax=Corynespora cassiicola Philippines TaxID=1448308 RepID=A0A2T2P3V9_CORCC|nr:hypothetical protein BS50DRAFT_249250 [Corynespora cassiicola Philippines]